MADSLNCISEKNKLEITEFNNTNMVFEGELNLKSLFEKQVATSPNNIALIYENESYTYSEFNAQANKLAHYLAYKGVKKGDVIAVICERSTNMMLCIYSILKLGAIYVPVDSELPQSRIDYILSQSEVKLILTQSDVSSNYNKQLYKTFLVDEINTETAGFPDSDPQVKVNPGDLAYIIFTSGSTGKPKGVMNQHSGVSNVMLWMKEEFKPIKGDVVLQKTPYSFDISLFEIYWPLLVGATVALAKPNSHKDAYQIHKQISKYSVTLLHIVPSILNALISAKPFDKTSLRAVVCCGEALLPDSVKSFFESYKSTKLINIYGPTEAAIAVSIFHCNKNEGYKAVPIGKPISNTKLHILDENLNQVPIGVAGEIAIEGVQVARGYVGDDELTQKQFVHSPFFHSQLYKTGDLARWNYDGELEFLGRSDSQVKFNGLRIELSEIETVMHQYENIEQSVAIIENSPNGSTFIGVLYTVEDKNEEIEESRLKSHMAKDLPSYMLPVSYMKLAQFPLTSSGKINRNQLPRIVLSEVTNLKRNDESLTMVQQTVIEAWKATLKHDNFSIDSLFFEVGGDSMSLMQVFNILDKAFPKKLSSVDLFRFVTVKSIAKFLDDHKPAPEVKTTRASKMRLAMKRNARPKKSQKECDV